MKEKGTVVGIVILIIYVAMVYVMVAPQSKGPNLVQSVTGGLANLLGTAMGGTPTVTTGGSGGTVSV